MALPLGRVYTGVQNHRLITEISHLVEKPEKNHPVQTAQISTGQCNHSQYRSEIYFQQFNEPDPGTIQHASSGSYKYCDVGIIDNFQKIPQSSNDSNDQHVASATVCGTVPHTTPISLPAQEETLVSDDEVIEYTYMFDPFPLDSTDEDINKSIMERFKGEVISEHPPKVCGLEPAINVYDQTPTHLVRSESNTTETAYYQSNVTLSSKAGAYEKEEVVITQEQFKTPRLPCYSCAVNGASKCCCVTNHSENKGTTELPLPIQSLHKEDLKKKWIKCDNRTKKNINEHKGINCNQTRQHLIHQRQDETPAQQLYSESYTSNNSCDDLWKRKQYKERQFVPEHKQLVTKQFTNNRKKHSKNSHVSSSPKTTFISTRTTPSYPRKNQGVHMSLTGLHENCDSCKGCRRLNLKLKAGMLL